MKKKALILMILLPVLIISGCGGKGAGNQGTQQVVQTETVTDDTVSKEEESEEHTQADTGAADKAQEESEDQTDTYTSIEVSWDESTVEYSGNPEDYDVGANEVCAPVLIIECQVIDHEETDAETQTYYDADGNKIAERTVSADGSMHNEKIMIFDQNATMRIYAEPSAPTNACPIDTITAVIKEPNGKENVYKAEDSMIRGGTGIWYFDVYER